MSKLKSNNVEIKVEWFIFKHISGLHLILLWDTNGLTFVKYFYYHKYLMECETNKNQFYLWLWMLNLIISFSNGTWKCYKYKTILKEIKFKQEENPKGLDIENISIIVLLYKVTDVMLNLILYRNKCTQNQFEKLS